MDFFSIKAIGLPDLLSSFDLGYSLLRDMGEGFTLSRSE